MPSFLDLPREVRDNIIGFVLCTSTGTPYDGTATGQRTELNDIEYLSWKARREVNYAKQFPVTSTSQLLLVNHQLHTETTDAINRSPSKHSYHLDVAIVNEEGLWPTWISVPALSTRVDKLHASFRVVGFLYQKGMRLFQGHQGSPPDIVWAFYSLLERFLKCGPVGHRKSPTDRRISIRLLEIDILSREDVPTSEEARKSIMVMVGDQRVLGSEFLLTWLSTFIVKLLSMSAHTALYGAILYERVGTIRLMLDGQMKRQWDLAEELENVQPAVQMSTWKEQAYKDRRAMRLPLTRTEGSKC